MKNNEMTRLLLKRGWTLEHKKKHIRGVPPQGGPFVMFPATPRIQYDKNILAKMKRAERGELTSSEAPVSR